MSRNHRKPADIQAELGQQVYGLGEVEFNFSQYETNRNRIVDKIKEISKELDFSMKWHQEEATKVHEKTLKNEADLKVPEAPREVETTAEALQ